MAKNSITDYSKTAASNTDIQSVDIAEGCLPSGINNAIREIMADLADVNDGTVALTSPAFTSVDINGGTIDGTVIGGASAAAGTFTTGQFNTSLNVDGTVTANALTVDGGATNFPIIVTSADQYAGIAFADNTTTTNAHVAVYADGNNLAFEAGNAERMRIDSSGRVGIGTSSPDASLHIEGSGVSALRFGNIGPSSNSAIRLSRDDITVTSGNPLGYLQFGGNDSTSNTDAAFAYVSGEASGTHGAGDNPTDLTFGTTADGSSTPAERLRIDSSGNVGIGTSSPATALDVNGTVTADSATLTGVVNITPASGYANLEMGGPSGAFIDFKSPASDDYDGRVIYNGASFVISTNAEQPVILQQNNATKLNTTATGVDVTGVAKASLGFQFGNSYLYEGATDQANMRIGTDGPYLEFIDAGSGVAEVGNASGPLALTASGTERLRIDSSGNVGIGTTSPAYRIDIQGSSNNALRIKTSSPLLRLEDSDDNAHHTFIGSSDDLYITSDAGNTGAGNMIFRNGGSTERMRIDSSGNVGIGTTSPAYELDVAGDARANTFYFRTNTASVPASVGGFYRPSLGDVAYGFNTNELFRITSTGLVGIGTDSPNGKLDVSSGNDADSGYVDLYIGGTSSSNARSGIIRKNTSSPYDMTIKASNYSSGNALIFDTGAGEKMRIDSSGNVLVNKTSTAIDPMGCMLKPNGQIFATTNGSDSFHNYDTSQNRYEFYVKGNGGIANYSSNNVNLSDETEKKNITAAASAWDDVKGLSLKEFHYTFEDDADPKQLGVIAQDVQVNHPDLIKSFKIDDDTDKLGVVEQQITWMAIKALQEAITKIEDLEARVATLEGN